MGNLHNKVPPSPPNPNWPTPPLPLTANRTWHKFKHSPFTPCGFSLSPPQKSNFSLNSSSESTRQVFAGLFLLADWGSSSVPYLQEAVPGSRANSHAIWGHSDAAHPVIVTSQDSWITPPPKKTPNILQTHPQKRDGQRCLSILCSWGQFSTSAFCLYSPTRSDFSVSQMLTLKSSYPANNKRPERDGAREVTPHMMVESW